jgi:uncharacterized protein involved in exopolysaccharide biosynthesis
VLKTLGSNDYYGLSEPADGADRGSSILINHYIDVFKRRFFYFLIPFGVVSIIGLYVAATQKPSYLSEGKILLEGQMIAPDIVRPVITATINERIQLIQQRVTTRDTLISVANKFGLFPQRPGVVEAMRRSVQIKPVEGDGPQRQNTSAIAFTVGFEYQDPEIAMRVANEFVNLTVGEDARSRTSRATEAVKILTDEAKSIENKLELTQAQILEVAQRPSDEVPQIPEQQKSDLAALAALKAELIQKSAVYSDAHPAVMALKKRINAMEKVIKQPSQAQNPKLQSTPDEMDVLKRQRDALERQLAEANSKLANARLGESQEQRTERMQVIEAPSLPLQPLKSNRLKMVGIFFAAAGILGVGTALGIELLDGSIRGRHQLADVMASSLVVCIPYIPTRADFIRARLKVLFGIVGVAIILSAWGGLAAAIVLDLPIDVAFDKVRTNLTGFSAADR